MKCRKRQLERRWKKSMLCVDKEIYTNYCKSYNLELESAKCDFYSAQLENCDDTSFFKAINSICGMKPERVLPSHDNSGELADQFANFFVEKIDTIRKDLDAYGAAVSDPLPHDTPISPVSFRSFEPLQIDDVRRVIMAAPSKSCALDPIPTPLLISCSDVLVPVITDIVNMSLTTGILPTSLKNALVLPILKKHNLDRNTLKNYRPVSLLPFLSKVIERCACLQLQKLFSTNNLNSHYQSAYRPNHGIETALLKVQNELLSAIDNNRESLLVLLDMSAAFDTIDHNILLRLRSRYNIGGTAIK